MNPRADKELPEYNTQRPHLIIHEYGRHIQKMIELATKQGSSDQKNKMARAIIDVMGNLNPHLRDIPDFQHKLWDQLFIISDFRLEVDSPFPKIGKEALSKRPNRLEYPKSSLRYRYYGKNILKMIEVAENWTDENSKDMLIFYIANYMKKSYLEWNKDTVHDAVIFAHLKELSHGKIDLSAANIELSDSEKLLKMVKVKPVQKNKRHKNNKNKPQ